MIRWAEVPRGSLGDELTAASEARAIARSLAEQGVDASSPLLRRSGPVSVHHQLSVLKEASECARDPLIAVRVGLGLHPTSYGIAGLRSSAALHFDRPCRSLSNMARSCVRKCELISSSPEARPGWRQRLLRSHARMPSVVRAVGSCQVVHLGTGSVEVSHQPSGAFGSRRAAPTTRGIAWRAGAVWMGMNCVSFDSALLDEPLPQADATTYQSCLRSCNDLISSLRRCDEIRRRVRRMVLSANGAVPTLSQVAGRLFLSTRTLRRRLEDAQTSYQEIVGETRRDLAVGYLTHTPLSTGAIAEILGYSDTANFRQAFKRWTGASPQRYRRLARSGGVEHPSPEAHFAPCDENAFSRYGQRRARAPNDGGPWMLSTC